MPPRFSDEFGDDPVNGTAPPSDNPFPSLQPQHGAGPAISRREADQIANSPFGVTDSGAYAAGVPPNIPLPQKLITPYSGRQSYLPLLLGAGLLILFMRK